MSRHRPRKQVELYREDGAFTVLVDLAAYDREDVEVSWRDGRLHVRAERLDPAGQVDRFHRQIGVPTPVEDAAIAASFEDGVLEVTLPIRGAADLEDRVIEVC